jgi:hypothetical protein
MQQLNILTIKQFNTTKFNQLQVFLQHEQNYNTISFFNVF